MGETAVRFPHRLLATGISSFANVSPTDAAAFISAPTRSAGSPRRKHPKPSTACRHAAHCPAPGAGAHSPPAGDVGGVSSRAPACAGALLWSRE